jgi:hypothetical protein
MIKWTGFLLALLIAIGWRYAASAQGNIVLENADGQSVITLGLGSDLTQLLENIEERILLEHANGSEYIPLAVMPQALSALLEQMDVRFVIEHANGNEVKGLAQPGGALFAALEAMLPRFVIEHANGNQFIDLGYPKELIGDKTPPTALTPEIQPTDPGIIITWDSNEFTRFVLRYGTSPGNYTETVTEPLYSLHHEVELTTLQDGQTYYFVIESEDISGNKSTTSEQKIEVNQRLFQFLPNLHRQTE